MIGFLLALFNTRNGCPIVVETYMNDKIWYRKYADGWLEQGGYVDAASSGTITMPQTFSTANINVIASWNIVSSTDSGAYGHSLALSDVTASTFRYSAVKGYEFSWRAFGY